LLLFQYYLKDGKQILDELYSITMYTNTSNGMVTHHNLPP
jgi:hypothetical protein